MQCMKCHGDVSSTDTYCTHCGSAIAFTGSPANAKLPAWIWNAAIGLAAVLAVAWTISFVVSAKRARTHKAEWAAQQKSLDAEMAKMRAAAEAMEKNTTPAPEPAPSSNAVPAAAETEKADAPAVAEPVVPVSATGDVAHDWGLKYERTENGAEADLVVRTGDINNLGFGWPAGFDPFSGKSTPVHKFPFHPSAGDPDGTDRIMLGSAVDPTEELKDPVKYNQRGSDGYSWILSDCALQKDCKARQEAQPRPVTLHVGALPAKIQGVVLQIFVDDFQPYHFHSHFQVSLNGTRIPSFEEAVNSLDQTGPIGKLITLRLLPEYWPVLKADEVKLLIDDPTTKVRDGYAMDFVRLLVNPHDFKYQVTVKVTVIDADTHHPIAGANVNAALESAVTDAAGKCEFKGVPAGLVVATANAPGYDSNSTPVDVEAGQVGTGVIELSKHREDAAALEKALAQSGTVNLYGIHFDTNSAKLRGDSLAALNALLQVINNHAGSRWTISGHTDSQGTDAQNQPLSEHRAAAVIAWLKAHGIEEDRLEPQGFGASRPVADNATAGGRALNRRVEVSTVQPAAGAGVNAGQNPQH